jgi:hypothetical protein
MNDQLACEMFQKWQRRRNNSRDMGIIYDKNLKKSKGSSFRRSKASLISGGCYSDDETNQDTLIPKKLGCMDICIEDPLEHYSERIT